jgi:phospholipase C
VKPRYHALCLVAAALASTSFAASAQATPIQHVVIVYQENHSFDNVLGRLCVRSKRCNGTRSGLLPDGSRIRLSTASDLVPHVSHSPNSQAKAIDGGKMDGWARLKGCEGDTGYQCLSQFSASQIPNLAKLARHFVISDRTFQMDTIPSWGAHVELVAANLGGFTGFNPPTGGLTGWGCDSQKEAPWQATPKSLITLEPTCFPDYDLDPLRFPYGGAYRKTPVEPMPTIMDELDQAGISWRLYSTSRRQDGYSWAICPTFAQCRYTAQHKNAVPRSQVLTDAENGTLPQFSVVLPNGAVSQHNTFSMSQGDNWIGQVVSSIEASPDWSSTAILITYDDCGCFYDHVAPPKGLGLRVPMVIVSPYAKPGYTDSTRASIASPLAFTEHTFGIPALGTRDASAYDYSNAFDFSQPPTPKVKMSQTPLPKAERQRLSTITHPDDDT